MSVRHKVKELIDKKYEEIEKINKNPIKVYVVFSPKDNLEDFDPELAEVIEFELDKESEESKKKFLDRLLREVLEAEVKNMVWCGFVVDTKDELIPILEHIPQDEMVEFISLKKED